MVDHRNLGVVNLLDVLGKRAVGGLQHGGVTLGITRNEREACDDAHDERDDDRDGHRNQTAEQGAVRQRAQREDFKRHGHDDRDEDDPAPHLRALQIERRVEPPVARRKRDDKHDGSHDEGTLAPPRKGIEELIPSVRGAAPLGLLMLSPMAVIATIVRRAAIGRILGVADDRIHGDGIVIGIVFGDGNAHHA